MALEQEAPPLPDYCGGCGDAFPWNSTIPKQALFPAGTQFDATKALIRVIETASTSLILIDNYVGVATLDLLAVKRATVVAQVLTKALDAGTRAAAVAFIKQHGDLRRRQ